MKRFLAYVLTIVMLMGLVVPASAAEWADGPEVSVSAEKTTDGAEVRITFAGNAALGAVSLNLIYDPALVEVDNTKGEYTVFNPSTFANDPVGLDRPESIKGFTWTVLTNKSMSYGGDNCTAVSIQGAGSPTGNINGQSFVIYFKATETAKTSGGKAEFVLATDSDQNFAVADMSGNNTIPFPNGIVSDSIAFPISALNVSLAQPVTGDTIPGALADADAYTSSIVWTNDKTGEKATGKFEPETPYTAEVTLTPKSGYAFADGLTVQCNGEPVALNGYTFTVNFPATAALLEPTITLPTASGITYGDTLAVSTLAGGAAEYNGTPVAGTFKWTDDTIVPTVNNIGYEVTFTPNNTSVYASVTRTVVVAVAPLEIAKPVASDETLTYDGSKQTFEYATNPDKDYVVVIGDTSGKDAGSYTATASLKDTANTVWADGTKTPVELSWTINPKTVTPTVELEYTTTEYTGGDKEPEVIVKDGSTVIDESEYTVDYLNNTNVGDATVTVSDNNADGNYVIATVNKTFQITKAAVPDSVMDAIKGYEGTYDGEAHNAVEGVPASGYTVKYKTSENGVYSENMPKVTKVADSGTIWVQVTSEDGNYGPTEKTVTATVNKASLVKPSLATTEFQYNGVERTVTLIGYDDKTMAKVDTERATDVGNYTVNVDLVDKNNYQWSDGTDTAVSLDWSITKASLTITAQDHTITYGDAPANNGVTYTGFVNDETESVLVGALGYDYGYTQYGNVGAYTITPKGLTSSNYDITFVPGTLTVEQKEVGLDWNNATARVFGDGKTVTATATGLVNSDSCTVTVTGGDATTVGGPYTATATGLSNSNYKLPADDTKQYTIAKADAPAGDYASKVIEVYFGNTASQTVPTSAFEILPTGITGVSIAAKAGTLTGDDVVASYTGNTFALKTLTDANVDNVASWTVVVSSDNYNDFEATVNIKIVNKTPVTVSGVSVAGKTYDGQPVAATGTPTATETVDGFTYTYEGTGSTVYSSTTAPAAAGTYKLVVAVEDDQYMGQQEISFTIAKKDVTITGLSAESRQYNRNTDATVTGTAVVSGVVEGDTVAVTAGTAAFADKNVGANKTVTFSGYALDGEDAGNYNLTAQPASVTATIFAKPVTVSGIAATDRPYKAGNVEVELTGGTVSDVISGDTVTVDLTGATATMNDANAGNDKAVTVIGVKLGGGADAGNYVLSAQPTGVTVNIEKIDWDGTTAITDAEEKFGKTLAVDLTGYLPADAAGLTASVTAGNTYVSSVSVSGKALSVALADNSANVGKTATVKVTVPESTNYLTYDITVTVTVLDKYAQTMTFAAATQTKTYGDAAFTVQATNVADNAAVTYESSDETVATVDNTGKVTIVGAGTATITATAAATAEYQIGTASYTLTVNKATIIVTANDRTAYLNDELPDLSAPVAGTDYTVYGLVGNDQLGGTIVMGYEKDGSAVTPDMKEVGTYDIVISGATAPAGNNYNDIRYVKGELNITQRSGGSSVTFYKVNEVSSKHGSVSFRPGKTSAGSQVVITVNPDEGYELDELIVTDTKGKEIPVSKNKQGNYVFKMPAGNVFVEAVFEKIEEEVEVSFSDVNEDAYYFDAVEWAVQNGVTTGYANGTFMPNNTCTRAQTVTFLWRAMGCPAPEDDYMPFTDVDEDAYYYDAVLWALENGITTGVTATTFAPNKTVSRAQTVTFLWRTARISGYDVSVGEDTNILSYEDALTIPEYAISALQWACGDEILGGYADGTLRPNAGCTRAHIVTFLYRFLAE